MCFQRWPLMIRKVTQFMHKPTDCHNSCDVTLISKMHQIIKSFLAVYSPFFRSLCAFFTFRPKYSKSFDITYFKIQGLCMCRVCTLRKPIPWTKQVRKKQKFGFPVVWGIVICFEENPVSFFVCQFIKYEQLRERERERERFVWYCM
jgi:hypothetical protein